MAEEKKPKIDLKARLGKTSAGQVPPGPTPAPGAVIPAPTASVPGAMPAPASSPSRTPPPPAVGVPIGPPPFTPSGRPAPIDPSNPLAAVAAPPAPRSAPAVSMAPAPARIEIDEASIAEARKGALKQGVLIGAIMAAVFGAIGYFAGGAQEQAAGRSKAAQDAVSLAADAEKAKATLKELADKVDQGRTMLVKERKFPSALAKELGGINVAFDGTELAGRRFSGFSTETTSGLVDFITSVQELNDRKDLVVTMLSKLEKPISEQLAGAGGSKVQHVVLLDKDPSQNTFAILAPLTQPIEINPARITMPNDFTAVNPLNKQVVTASNYKKGDPAKNAVYVLPKSFDGACPSETAGAIAQLATQLGRLVGDIRGAGNEQEFAAPDQKAGLLERADRLIDGLKKVK